MFDLPLPLELIGSHAQKSGQRRRCGALAISAVANEIACGFAGITPGHGAAYATAGQILHDRILISPRRSKHRIARTFVLKDTSGREVT
jgi:hypothetical protein